MEMSIKIEDKQVFHSIEILTGSQEFYPLECIVDTGFTGTIAFPVSEDLDYFRLFEFSEIKLLPEDEWLVLADGHKARTFAAHIVVKIRGEFDKIAVRLIETECFQPPLLGIDFLEFFEGKLVLDFVE